ncbi:hypothetical protein AGMMS49593_00360 [Endomicrobiia bacterium]|nr:hypothetical protein AGMMS49593_00360 [Endomicrobiia bacterium]
MLKDRFDAHLPYPLRQKGCTNKQISKKTHKEENKIKTKVRCESSICVWTYEANTNATHKF